MGVVGAFDASGDESSQLVIVVAGFVSSAQCWEDFSEKWLERLASDGISYMHMREFAHSRGQFANGWKENEPRRKALLSDLIDIIKAHAFHKFGVVVTNETFKNTLSLETLKEWHLNGYALAGRSCGKQINEWLLSERWNTTIEMVFEEGDRDATLLHVRLVEDSYQAPIFKPKKDRRTHEGVLLPAFVPLQAADFLAYEIFLEVTRTMQNSPRQVREPLIAFDRILGEIGTYKVEDLKQFQNLTDITKRVDDWLVQTGILFRDEHGRLCQKFYLCNLPLFTWGRVSSPYGVDSGAS